MIGLLQRVSSAEVRVDGAVVGAIGRGILVFVAVTHGDTPACAERLLERLLSYRVFADTNGRMNLSTRDVAGGLLLVPQFTLAADTATGTRAGFSKAAPADAARSLFGHLLGAAQRSYAPVSAGVFGAAMQVSLVNDGPVTFWLETP
jgi:D-aminoacyl-tRNA deacylase